MVDLLSYGNVHRGRECVIRALAHIYVVIRVNRFFRPHFTAHHFNSAVRDYFIGIHVALCARACLKDNKREMLYQCPFDDFFRRGDDVLSKVLIQNT